MKELDLSKIERSRSTAPSVTIAANAQLTISKAANKIVRKKMSGAGPYVKVLWDPATRSIGIEGAPSPKNSHKSPLLELHESKEGQLQTGIAFLCNSLDYDYKGSGSQRFDVESKSPGRIQWVLPEGKHPKAIQREKELAELAALAIGEDVQAERGEAEGSTTGPVAATA